MKLILTFVLLFSSYISDHARSAVTYNFSGGRFGDSLVSYCHALWISYKFDLTLIYKPFKYSDQLLMHESDILYCPDSINQYTQALHINHALQYGVQLDTLYVVPFFCESHIEKDDPRCPFLFQVDWKNEGFINELKRRICPHRGFELLNLPHDSITVAVHVRKGTGWDIPQFAPSFEKLTEMHPLKWPPDSYYIEQIKYLMNVFPHQKLFIQLFTDHDKPQEIMEKYRTIINDSRITWKCRNTNNRHDLNVLEDFFALTQFDCLIRNDSNFSIIASKLGNYKVLIAPWESQWEDEKIVITQVMIESTI